MASQNLLAENSSTSNLKNEITLKNRPLLKTASSFYSLLSLKPREAKIGTWSQSSDGFISRYTPHRFTARSIFLTVIPALILAYYVTIWRVLTTSDVDSLVYGHRNASWVFYSWFVVGVFGLNVSKYGLAGVEAAMLQTSFWGVDNTMALLMHNEKSWSGPSGWARALKRPFLRKKSITHRLWYLLALLSFIVSVALPLSGLSMELFDGYVWSSELPSVIGRTRSNFEVRQIRDLVDRMQGLWPVASPLNVPGIGILYTPPYVDRKRFACLSQIPNTLPTTDDGMPPMFLIPQSTAPVRGKAWGLLISYNCSIAKSSSDFKVLLKPANDTAQYEGDMFVSDYGTGSINVRAYGEVGGTSPSFNIQRQGTDFEYSDPSRTIDLEYILWQQHGPPAYPDAILQFNTTLDPIIRDAGGPEITDGDNVYVNRTFFELRGITNQTIISDSFGFANRTTSDSSWFPRQPAIGARCVVNSRMGTAEVRAASSTYHFFQDELSVFSHASTEETLKELGRLSKVILSGQYHNIISAINAPPPLAFSNSAMMEHFVTPPMVRLSMMHALGIEALQLMYDGLNTFESAFTHENLTTSRPGKVLGPGAVPPIVPAILLGIWALSCAVLGIFYGFRLRWSETLDGFSYYCFGAYSAPDIHDRSIFATGKRFDEYEMLRELPGLGKEKQQETHHDEEQAPRRRFAWKR
ncbi:hypothetical protein FQN57_001889 [Myotisia sp. PD_48]|nr:hypothetical protein FQN57_001889 [Myotisia sp. PD_48]